MSETLRLSLPFRPSAPIPVPTSLGGGNEDDCPSPGQLATVNGVLVCEQRCTEDQTFLVEEETSICVPVRCRDKYAGARDFYNSDTRMCEPLTYCSADRQLDIVSNTCFAGPKSETVPNSTPTAEHVPNSKISCGEHGESSEEGTSCRCEKGWTSNLNQDMFSFQWCAVQVPLGDQNSPSPSPPPAKDTGGVVEFIVNHSLALGMTRIGLIVAFFACILLFSCFCGVKLLPRLKKWMILKMNPAQDEEQPEGFEMSSGSPFTSANPHYVVVPLELLPPTMRNVIHL